MNVNIVLIIEMIYPFLGWHRMRNSICYNSINSKSHFFSNVPFAWRKMIKIVFTHTHTETLSLGLFIANHLSFESIKTDVNEDMNLILFARRFSRLAHLLLRRLFDQLKSFLFGWILIFSYLMCLDKSKIFWMVSRCENDRLNND